MTANDVLYYWLPCYKVADLQFLMKQYEHWANRLFPKYTFKDVTQRIERLSTTKEFKVC